MRIDAAGVATRGRLVRCAANAPEPLATEEEPPRLNGEDESTAAGGVGTRAWRARSRFVRSTRARAFGDARRTRDAGQICGRPTASARAGSVGAPSSAAAMRSARPRASCWPPLVSTGGEFHHPASRHQAS
eukprot:255005-Prymnesium_polylepis.2